MNSKVAGSAGLRPYGNLNSTIINNSRYQALASDATPLRSAAKVKRKPLGGYYSRRGVLMAMVYETIRPELKRRGDNVARNSQGG